MLDILTQFSDKQDLAKVAGTYLSSKSIDLGANGSDVFGNTTQSDPGASGAKVLAQVTTAFVGATATVKAQLISADDAALTSNVTVLESTDAIPVASLVVGYQFRFGSLPPGITQRYLGMQYVIATATTTAGNVSSGLVADKSTVNVH